MGYPAFFVGSDKQPAEEYWTRLPVELKNRLLAYIANYDSPPNGELDGPCVWLDVDSGRCKHHEFRPKVCRDFRTGSRACLDWRAVYLVS